METGPDATVITFPARHTAAAWADIGAALTALDTDRSLQFGDLEHVDDPIAFTADLGDLIDSAARTVAVAENQIQTATELWNSENQQH